MTEKICKSCEYPECILVKLQFCPYIDMREATPLDFYKMGISLEKFLTTTIKEGSLKSLNYSYIPSILLRK